ncbi:44830_t:CDS:2 [Gigaspora margarita]|uniref:44830_t:CDS:1 n=1 Tax=Gigaspora margarita TaxID=4874 RepID=A0ABN7UPA4_GIGMA|nr:44830_t:CDS:2 [Gigaspora margarita]
MTKVITYQTQKLQQIITRKEKPEWWICGCPYYPTSQFGICKHLVQQKGPISGEFFDHIKRNHQPPFLAKHGYNLVKTESVNIEYNVLYSNIDNDLNKNSNELYNELMILTTKALNLLEVQKSVGNSQWVRSLKKNFSPISRMVKEIEQYKRKRTLS